MEETNDGTALASNEILRRLPRSKGKLETNGNLPIVIDDFSTVPFKIV